MEREGQVGRDVVIRCENVGKTFGNGDNKNEVIRDFTLDIYANEFIVLFGPAQCGKTTLLKMIAGLETVSSGKIQVSGRDVAGPQTELGMVYQSVSLFPWLTVMGNVEFGPEMRGMDKAQRRKKAQHYIDLVGLQGFEDAYPIKLSGGMKQRVGIARAYCNDPSVILMDEPFGALDAQTRYMMEEEIERICSQDKRTVLFVTNNIEEAVYLADRIILVSPSPSAIVEEYVVELPRPRDLISEEFLELRKVITAKLDEGSGYLEEKMYKTEKPEVAG